MSDFISKSRMSEWVTFTLSTATFPSASDRHHLSCDCSEDRKGNYQNHICVTLRSAVMHNRIGVVGVQADSLMARMPNKLAPFAVTRILHNMHQHMPFVDEKLTFSAGGPHPNSFSMPTNACIRAERVLAIRLCERRRIWGYIFGEAMPPLASHQIRLCM